MPRGQYDRKPRTIIGADVESMTDFDGARPAESARPPQAAAPSVKKGRKSWGSRDVLGVTKKDPNFAYKWVRKEPMNIARHLDLGYEFCGKVVNEKAVHVPTERMYDGADLTTNIETRDSILMRLPNDLKAERDEWLSEKNAMQSAALQNDKKNQTFSDALKGDVSIQGGNFKNIIE